MFTGIVEQIGKIESIKGSTFVVSHNFKKLLKLGESIALNGACMTVIDCNQSNFSVVITEESRNRTSFSGSQIGNLINLERSALIGERNSGHNVAGHVDETGVIIHSEAQSDFWRMRIQISPENRKYIIEKGSIAVEGISLTISDLGPDWFEIAVIPHTWEHTTLHTKDITHLVNVEYDQYGKYILNAA